MRIDWTLPRSKGDLDIPPAYLAHDPQTQSRRELTFLLQEAAFSEHIPIYCVIDLTMLRAEEQDLFVRIAAAPLEPLAAILVGIPIQEPLLLMEQWVPETEGRRPETMAQLKIKNYLYSMEEKLDMEGYQSQLLPPGTSPDPAFARLLACSRKGFAGRNGYFVTPDYGAKMCIGLLLTDAPLMGGDYRYSDYLGPGCGSCRKCIEACPCGALTERGYDKEMCRAYRDHPAHQEEVAPYSHLKCLRCMLSCEAESITK